MKNENLKTELKKDQAYADLLKIAGLARIMKTKAIEDMTPEAGEPLNYFIKKIYGLENQEMATFKGWISKGFSVKKGEKAFIFFSSPKSIKVKGKNIITGEDSENSFNRFCKCYLFTKNQVEPLKA
jgi:hypothetical protein